MKVLTQILNFYINCSIHVALSCYALVRMTQHMFHISYENSIANFAFFGTIVGYNFVKYDALVRKQKVQMRYELKAIAFFSFCSLVLVGFYFFQLKHITQIVAFIFLSVTLLYTLPFFPNKRNARNWAGVKIYIVALCWVGVTLVLPILNAEVAITFNFYLKCIQRFFLLFVLILIFEINDLANDDPHLQTVPQQIGVKQTKVLGLWLIILFFFLEFLKNNFDQKQIVVNFILVVLVSLFLLFANEKRSKFYTSFWVESIPIFWWLTVVFL
ncbi:hypothetical protein SAMN05444372_10648 [Flavobacterium micromati]|uniref:Prenyltransferase n=1 Tax=Flavobacterium micromati TaxID=229205 RepID=A0A1M5JY44_9FLAO|nr:hypothetical protein [Flavobacterium micromati]MCL6461325.1 hypothetical protein [Flavobacterium micromati]SHG45240.1 hypothetical protein SAMN05444372_10648 [Flavobacterium micromati]